ncbi:MAG: DUF222 domain-containing protein [Kineosporiaceae bacterium]|nr:DUF222 domain-containing protein [Kineosporiaceae bacterium]
MEPEQTPTPDGEETVGNSGLPGIPDGDADAAAMSTPPVVAVLEDVSAQLRSLQTAPTLTLSDGELRDALIAAHRVANQVEAATLHLVRALDDRPEAMPTCAPGKVAATFLVHALRVDPGTAARDVAAARALDPDGAGVGVDTGTVDSTGPDAAASGLPEVGAALAAGDISRRHVDHAVGCLGRIDRDVLTHVDPDGISGIQRVDEFLAEMARKHAPHVFRRLCTQLEEALNPDKGFDPKAHEKRFLHLGTDSNGMLIGRFALSPADGLIVRNVIHALSKPTTAATTSDTEAEAGGDGQVQGELPLRDPRTAAQRRADALTHLARLALHRGTDPDADTNPHASSGSDADGSGSDSDADGSDSDSDADGSGSGSDDDDGGSASGAEPTTPRATAPTTRTAPTPRRGPTPPPSTGVHISLIATLDQLTAALRPTPTPGAGLGSDLGPGGGPLPRHVLAQMLCQKPDLPHPARQRRSRPGPRTSPTPGHPRPTPGGVRPRSGLRDPRLHRTTGLVRRPPRHPLGRGRVDRRRRNGHGLQPGPHRRPRRDLDHHHDQRCALGHPPTLDRPTPTTRPQHPPRRRTDSPPARPTPRRPTHPRPRQRAEGDLRQRG